MFHCKKYPTLVPSNVCLYVIIRINVEADPKARTLCRSQKVEQYSRKGLCKRARIKCIHELTIYTGYRVPVRALITGTYCCWYVTQKPRHQDQHRHSVVQSYIYVQTYQRCRAHRTQIYLRRVSLELRHRWIPRAVGMSRPIP